MRVLFFVGMLAIANAASGQTVFKCKNPDGTSTYSEKPCSKDASSVQQINVRAPQPPTVDPAAAENMEKIRLSNEKAGIARGEEYCLRDASDRIYPPLRRRVAEIDTKIAQLRNAIRYSSNNLAGATFANGLREQISTLEQIRSTEMTSADSQMSSERTRCAEERRAADAAFRARQELTSDGG